MRRIIHITDETTYRLVGGLLFIDDHFEPTIVICHQPDALDGLVEAVRHQQEELSNGDPGDSGHDS